MSGWIAFLVLSGVFGFFSLNSLKHRHSHGFYRFVAWEFILALVILNSKVWFHDPWSWHQIVSWILLIISIFPLVLGILQLKKARKSALERSATPGLLAFEQTTELVTTGIYRYIRHPMYSSLLLLAWGAFFKSPALIGGLLAGSAAIFLYLTARADEGECIAYFGSEYREYMGRTKMFIPFLI